jgi:hypothetical protein
MKKDKPKKTPTKEWELASKLAPGGSYVKTGLEILKEITKEK